MQHLNLFKTCFVLGMNARFCREFGRPSRRQMFPSFASKHFDLSWHRGWSCSFKALNINIMAKVILIVIAVVILGCA